LPFAKAWNGSGGYSNNNSTNIPPKMASYPSAIGVILLLITLTIAYVSSFQVGNPKSDVRSPISSCSNRRPRQLRNNIISLAAKDDDMSTVDEYRNAPTAILSNFMQKEKDTEDPFVDIDFDASKSPKLSLQDLAAILDYELYNKEWFVTGSVNPIYFDDKFQFQDPDVKLTGIEEYARGVYKLFDQSSSRAEIISTVVNSTIPNTITVTWRLSGGVSIGPGLTIKPYIVYTDFTIDEDSGLIVFQEDRFSVQGWDILLSALFPFLIGKVTSEPAPPVEPRVVEMPKIAREKKGGLFDGLFQQIGL